MRIQFLGMEDCPTAPLLKASLDAALTELNAGYHVEMLDLPELAQQGDVRAGYGSPTILVDGVDLFGLSPSGSAEPSCRLYRDGVPAAAEILRRLRSIPGV